MHTGKVIKLLREQAGMTQGELGKALCVNKSTVQKYENGMVQNLKIKTIRKLCEIFVVPPKEFIYPEFFLQRGGKEADNKLKQTLLLAKIYNQLNKEGQKQIYSYLKNISETPQYQKKTVNLENDIIRLRELLILNETPFRENNHEIQE